MILYFAYHEIFMNNNVFYNASFYIFVFSGRQQTKNHKEVLKTANQSIKQSIVFVGT